MSRLRHVAAALWGRPEDAPPSSNWLGVQLSISRVVTFALLTRAGTVIALWLGAYDYEALSVGLALGLYGLVGVKYVLIALDKYAATIANECGRIVLVCLWLLTLSGPVLFAGVWISLQPLPNTTWYGRLVFVVVAIALVIAGLRETVSIGAHAAHDKSTAT